MTNERFPPQAHKSGDTGRGSARPAPKSQTSFFSPPFTASRNHLPPLTCMRTHADICAESRTHQRALPSIPPCTLPQMVRSKWHPRCSLPIWLWRGGLADWPGNTPRKTSSQLGVARASKWKRRAFKPAPLEGPGSVAK